MLLLNARGVQVGLATRPTAVLSVHIVTAPAAWLISRALGIPFALYLHADEMRARPDLTRWACRRADGIVAVSRYTRDLALRAGADPGRVQLVPNGVDLPERRQAQRAQRPTVVTVSALNRRYKGHDVVMRALPLVRARVPAVEWAIIGDGPLRPSLERLAAALGVQDVVRFVGAVPDFERDAWLDRAHVFAMPSRLPAGDVGGEGFGVVYLEAGAHGVPTVAGNVAGAVDAVEDGCTGLLVDPTDHVAVADALTELLIDPARAEALGARGRERAEALAWSKVAAQVEDVLLALADGRGRRRRIG
jgi:phosphatidylinositol alpha-1,6-mannosyltransferase